MAHALARALAPQPDSDALAARLQRLHVGGDRLEYVLVGLAPLGGKILTGMRGDVDGVRGAFGRGEWRQLCERRVVQPRAPFVFGKIKPVGRQRLIRRTAAVL